MRWPRTKRKDRSRSGGGCNWGCQFGNRGGRHSHVSLIYFARAVDSNTTLALLSGQFGVAGLSDCEAKDVKAADIVVRVGEHAEPVVELKPVTFGKLPDGLNPN